MRLPSLLSVGVACIALALASADARALDTTAPQHPSKTSQRHLSAAHHVRRHTRRAHSHAVVGRPASSKPGVHAASVRRPVHRYAHRRATVRRTRYRVRRHRYYERFTASSFAQGDIFAGDVTTGEDPVVRQAAIDAMGNMNGTAVVINASNGRILAMVNQKLALSPGAEPCSTIKLSVALAALSEGLVTRDTMVRLPGFRMNMTEAIAHSNNLYFEELGRELGFERVHHYASEFGLGELAGWHIPGEHLGEYPDQPIPQADGGVGRMCSFGQGVSMTPLQLGALVAAIANGGTLYYLQHPTTPEEIADFQPRVKRVLNISKYIPELQDGMAGAVEYGTARSLRTNFRELPVFGKTGTCSDKGTRFGWFASYSDTPEGPIVTVFLLEGGRPTFGPRAAELTGEFYRNLWDRNYFNEQTPQTARVEAHGTVSSGGR
jgi:penicillin-binding protein 2